MAGESKAAKNEKIKLTATLLNTVASGTILAAIVAPYIGMGMGTLTPNATIWNLLGLSGFGFTVGLVIHFLALRASTRLED